MTERQSATPADDIGRANPNPGPGFTHDFHCTHDPCRCALARWVSTEWSPNERAVINVAQRMARDARRPWWSRRKPTPMDFVPAARAAVNEMLLLGWSPPVAAMKQELATKETQ